MISSINPEQGISFGCMPNDDEPMSTQGVRSYKFTGRLLLRVRTQRTDVDGSNKKNPKQIYSMPAIAREMACV